MKKFNSGRLSFTAFFILLITTTACRQSSTKKLSDKEVDKIAWEQYNDQIRYFIPTEFASNDNDDKVLSEKKWELVWTNHPANDPYLLSMYEYVAEDLAKMDSVFDSMDMLVHKGYTRLYYRGVTSNDGLQPLVVLLGDEAPSDSAKERDMQWLRTLPRVQKVEYLTPEEEISRFIKGGGDTAMHRPPHQYRAYISIEKLREEHMDTMISFIEKNIPGSNCTFVARSSDGYQFVYEFTQKYIFPEK